MPIVIDRHVTVEPVPSSIIRVMLPSTKDPVNVVFAESSSCTGGCRWKGLVQVPVQLYAFSTMALSNRTSRSSSMLLNMSMK